MPNKPKKKIIKKEDIRFIEKNKTQKDKIKSEAKKLIRTELKNEYDIDPIKVLLIEILDRLDKLLKK